MSKFEYIVENIRSAVEFLDDEELERIIFLCWSEQQTRRNEVPSQLSDNVLNVFKELQAIVKEVENDSKQHTR